MGERNNRSMVERGNLYGVRRGERKLELGATVNQSYRGAVRKVSDFWRAWLGKIEHFFVAALPPLVLWAWGLAGVRHVLNYVYRCLVNY